MPRPARSHDYRRGGWVIALQCVLVPIVLGVAAFAPPARGQIMLVSLAGESGTQLAASARAAGVFPLQAPSRNRTLLALGDGRGVLLPLLMRGILPMRVTAQCGQLRSTEER